MRRSLVWVPLVVSLSVTPAAAERIDFGSFAELEATGIGSRIAHRQQSFWTDGRYDDGGGVFADGSVARGYTYGLYPDWFSDVYFNGSLYTYAYGVTELICSNCDSRIYQVGGEADLLGGELVGATLGDRWGSIMQQYWDGRAGFDPLAVTPNGFTFYGGEVTWFYLQSGHAPAEMLGILSGTSRISGLESPSLTYTMGMDAYVPSAPIPEPGTFVLLTTGLAGALIRRRYQRGKKTEGS